MEANISTSWLPPSMAFKVCPSSLCSSKPRSSVSVISLSQSNPQRLSTLQALCRVPPFLLTTFEFFPSSTLVFLYRYKECKSTSISFFRICLTYSHAEASKSDEKSSNNAAESCKRRKTSMPKFISQIVVSVLEWRDGYYNGDIKTRKTVQSMDLEMEADKTGLPFIPSSRRPRSCCIL